LRNPKKVQLADTGNTGDRCLGKHYVDSHKTGP